VGPRIKSIKLPSLHTRSRLFRFGSNPCLSCFQPLPRLAVVQLKPLVSCRSSRDLYTGSANMSKFLLAAGLIASVYGSPLQERGVSCQAVNGIINIMRAQSVVTPFCSSVLAISTVTQTSSVTSTPPCKTITTSVPTTDVITSYSTSTVYG